MGAGRWGFYAYGWSFPSAVLEKPLAAAADVDFITGRRIPRVLSKGCSFGCSNNYALPFLLAVQMPPATRVYVLLLMLITAVDVSVGKVIDSGNTFSLDWGRTLKVTPEYQSFV